MVGEYSKEDGKKLLELARASIKEEFEAEKPKFPEGKQFRQARGVFVTLMKNSELRGCIGFPLPIKPVAQAVYEAAKLAASADSRFTSIEHNEISKIRIEISILTNPTKCKPGEVRVGKDGLIAGYMGYSGLLLPQVAIENKFSRLQFLEAVCQKAGLPADSWQKPGFKLERFQAEIFCED